VADLNQAIGLLGIKPLKLLVLGFSLPNALFAELAARELEWYWTNTLTRAVAARLLAEQLWHRAPHEVGSGDEAFTAGLLQDIGILVLLHELGAPYAKFLTGVIDEKCHLAALEQDILGFDHLQLSAALLKKWQLPPRLVEAIALPKRSARLARMTSPEADLPQILHLAEMLMQLVGQRRLQVLPELLEAGKEYRGLTKSKLAMLVEGLQPQVDQLADVLSLELADKRDYVQMLLEAHQRMAALSEQIAGQPSPSGEDPAYAQLLSHTDALSSAMQDFLDGKSSQRPILNRGPHSYPDPSAGNAALAAQLAAAATRCRDRRQELSLVIVEPNVYDIHADPLAENASRQMQCALEYACARLGQNRVMTVAMSPQRIAAILSNCERRAAVAVAQNAIAELARLASPHTDGNGDLSTTLSFGVATASIVPRNFDPDQMIESAARCLSAARGCGISAVKSIEV
jgi:HD-like signal output (HDOD) protein